MTDTDTGCIRTILVFVTLIGLCGILFYLCSFQFGATIETTPKSIVINVPTAAPTTVPEPRMPIIVAPTMDKAVDNFMNGVTEMWSWLVMAIVIISTLTCATVIIITIVKNLPSPLVLKNGMADLWFKIESNEQTILERDVDIKLKAHVVDDKISRMEADTSVHKAEAEAKINKIKNTSQVKSWN